MTATVAVPQRTRTHHGSTPRPLRQPGRRAAVVLRRRRRVAAAALAAALSALGLGAQAVLTDSGSVPASAVGVGTATATHRHVTAQPGDSLWSIAEAHRGSVPVRDYVDALVALNGGTTIIAGQAVALP